MNNYLLFDSSCMTCTKLASSIEHKSDRRLSAKSLYDSDMQKLLCQAKPNWKWEPTLLVVSENYRKAYTGLALQLKLVRLIGIKASYSILKMLSHEHSPNTLLKRVSYRILNGLESLAHPAIFRSSKILECGDMRDSFREFAGFVLLKEGDSMPSYIKKPLRLNPFVCHVGADGSHTHSNERVKYERYSDPGILKDRVKFELFEPKPFQTSFKFSSAKIVKHEDGEIYSVIHEFSKIDEATKEWVCAGNITAFPDYMRPYPLWESSEAEDLEIVIRLEKYSIGELQGILVRAAFDNVFHWIHEDIFYTMNVAKEIDLKAACKAVMPDKLSAYS